MPKELVAKQTRERRPDGVLNPQQCSYALQLRKLLVLERNPDIWGDLEAFLQGLAREHFDIDQIPSVQEDARKAIVHAIQKRYPDSFKERAALYLGIRIVLGHHNLVMFRNRGSAKSKKANLAREMVKEAKGAGCLAVHRTSAPAAPSRSLPARSLTSASQTVMAHVIQTSASPATSRTFPSQSLSFVTHTAMGHNEATSSRPRSTNLFAHKSVMAALSITTIQGPSASKTSTIPRTRDDARLISSGVIQTAVASLEQELRDLKADLGQLRRRLAQSPPP